MMLSYFSFILHSSVWVSSFLRFRKLVLRDSFKKAINTGGKRRQEGERGGRGVLFFGYVFIFSYVGSLCAFFFKGVNFQKQQQHLIAFLMK